MTTITQSFTAAAQTSGIFYPTIGDRNSHSGQFNVFLNPATFIGSVVLERCAPENPNTFYEVGVWSGGSFTQMNYYNFVGTEPNTSEIVVEPQQGVGYRLRCVTYTSGTLNASIEGGSNA